MIDAIILCIGGAAVIAWLQMKASMCDAKMDTVSHHYSTSIYKDEVRQWFDPMVSWTNKSPENVETWRALASEFLPKYVYLIINKIKPAYDPFSDFWHYQKFLFLLLEFVIAIVWGSIMGLSHMLDSSFLSFGIGMAVCAALWAGGWLLSFNKNLKKLQDNGGS